MACPVGMHQTIPLCEIHLIDMEFEQPSLFSTDRGYHEQGGGFFCRDCDKLALQENIGPWESDPDMGD